MTILKIAWRNIGRNKRRSILSIFAVTGSTALLIFMMAFQKGSYLSMINTTVKAHSGHLQVQRLGYLNDKDLSLKIENPEEIYSILKGIPEIISFSPRINAPALISRGSRTFGSLIWGIDPDMEASTSTLPKVIKRGEYLDKSNIDGVLMSEMLAKNLKADIGDEIVFLGQAADGSTAAGKLTVCGIFRFGINEIDRAVLVAQIETIQEIFSMEDGISEIAILLKDDTYRPEVVKTCNDQFTNHSLKDIKALGWPELSPGIEQSIKIDWNSGLIMYTVLVLVVAFGIANTFLMAFMERIHEYGILLSIGMRPCKMSLMAYAESVFLTFAGVLIGLITGISVTSFFINKGIHLQGADEIFAEYGMDPTIYPYLSAEIIIYACGIVGIITLLMAVYPAVKAGRLQPVKALRKI